MRIGRKVVGGVLTIILVTVLIAWNLSQPTPRLTRVQSSLLSDDLYVMDIEFGGIRTLSISNGSHLLLFDVYQENVTEVVRIPGEAIMSMNDITMLFDLVFVVNDESRGGLVSYYSGNLHNVTIPGIPDSTPFLTIAADPARNTLYLGSVESGIVIYERTSGTVTNLTATDGLLSNYITHLHVRAGKLVASMASGLNIYDLESKMLWNVTDLPESDVRSLEYSPSTDEVYVGTGSGLHICRLMGYELKYLRTMGPVDGLPSGAIMDLDLDPTSHKMIVSTGLGICTIDLYDYSVDVLDETIGSRFVPKALYHKYHGPRCYLYYGTSGNGIWRIVIDYSAEEPENIGPLLQDIVLVGLGGALALIGSVFHTEYERYRNRQDRERKQKQRVD